MLLSTCFRQKKGPDLEKFCSKNAFAKKFYPPPLNSITHLDWVMSSFSFFFFFLLTLVDLDVDFVCVFVWKYL